MKKYNTIRFKLKEKLSNFSDSICAGLSKPNTKFIHDMLIGILASGSVKLTVIGRALREDISLKKTEERLSRNLKAFTGDENLRSNISQMIKPHINDRTVYVIDGSDLAKPKGIVFEHLEKVHDGSTGELVNGYWTIEIAALTEETKSPVSVYDHVYSTSEAGFLSANNEVIKSLNYVKNTFGPLGVFTFDRGYDAAYLYDYLIGAKLNFVVRAKQNRKLLYKGELLGVNKIVDKFKGKYALAFFDKKGKDLGLKVSVIPIRLPDHPEVPLHLVVVFGFGNEPLMLYTNLSDSDSRLASAVSKVYLLRWRIEEHFRFKKDQFNIEDFRVRSLKSIRNLHRILTLLACFIALQSDQRDSSLFVREAICISKRIRRPKPSAAKKKFLGYALADAFALLLASSSVTLRALPRPPLTTGFVQLAIPGFAA